MAANTATTSPLAARRRLGDELRLLRQHSAMTAEEVGRALGCHYSKISRIENAKRPCTQRDFTGLMNLFAVEGEKLAELSALMIKGRTRVQPWWNTYKDVISAHYAEFLAYEAEAEICYDYQPLFVPALLQTAEYARAVTGVGFAALGPDQVDSLVEVRIRRQDRLRDEEPLIMDCVITEAALHYQVGGNEVRRRQLRHLRTVAELPHVSLSVIPFSAGENGIVNAGYTLFGSGKEDSVAEVSFTEAPDVAGFRDDALTLRRLERLFRNLSKSALSADSSLELVERIEKELI